MFVHYDAIEYKAGKVRFDLQDGRSFHARIYEPEIILTKGESMIKVGDIIDDGKHIVTRVEPLCGGDLAWVSWKDVEQEDDECPTNQ